MESMHGTVVEELELLTTADLVLRFGVTKATVEKWRRCRSLPYVRVTGRVKDAIRFRERDVVEWARKTDRTFRSR